MCQYEEALFSITKYPFKIIFCSFSKTPCISQVYPELNIIPLHFHIFQTLDNHEFIFIILLDYEHLADKQECSGGKETFKGRFKNVGECAAACRGESQLFIYGTNDYGNNRCNSTGFCKCYCEHNSEEFRCPTTSHTGYRLYAFVGKLYCLFIYTIIIIEGNIINN